MIKLTQAALFHNKFSGDSSVHVYGKLDSVLAEHGLNEKPQVKRYAFLCREFS